LTLRRIEIGTFTIVVVNWNTLDYLRPVIAGIRHFSPDETSVIVVDNGSDDNSSAWLRDQHDVRSILLPINIGHGPALDLAVCRVKTEFFATLDVDAFPITSSWQSELRRHLDEGNIVVGGHAHRKFAHPSMLAMRTSDFFNRGHSFIRSSWRSSDEFEHGQSWDVAERISMKEPGRVALIEPSSVRGPSQIGTIFGGLVYHNWYAAQGPDEFRAEAAKAWNDAVTRYIPADAVD
jgi:glycosyltransferase involved in cell wall biosynthesis